MQQVPPRCAEPGGLGARKSDLDTNPGRAGGESLAEGHVCIIHAPAAPPLAAALPREQPGGRLAADLTGAAGGMPVWLPGQLRPSEPPSAVKPVPGGPGRDRPHPGQDAPHREPRRRLPRCPRRCRHCRGGQHGPATPAARGANYTHREA